jgi:protein-L-isoaspartate(D-aspartate) O-methyltransferase
MATVPRHEFVPEEEQERAYADSPLQIGLGQTISQPYVVGLMTELLELSPSCRVLEIGTGSGYQTAILAELVAEVFTMEVWGELQRIAEQRLSKLGYHNIRFSVRNGHLGWPESAPFDRIIVTAGAASIPQPLIDQLIAGGLLVIPVGPAGDDQILQVVTKLESGSITIRAVAPVRFVPLVRE